MQPSDHFDGKRFFVPGKRVPSHGLGDLLRWRLFGKRPVWPRKVEVLPVPAPPARVTDSVRVTYIGHATLLIQAAGLNILTDPHFSQRASPFKWLGPQRVQAPGLSIEQLPPIDVIFVSHNHYDHLDLPSLRQLHQRDKPLVLTPLGNESIIRGAGQMNIHSLDWHDTYRLSERISFRLLPCQHWSARTLWDRNRALWGAGYFTLDDKTLLYVADSGFSPELFASIVAPDIVALPIGAYDPRWFMSAVHMSPEEAWRLFSMLRGRYLIPIHYDVFPLGDEPFGAALPRLQKAAGVDWNRVLPLKVGEHRDIS